MPKREVYESIIQILELFLNTDGPIDLTEFAIPHLDEAFEELQEGYLFGSIKDAYYCPHPIWSRQAKLRYGMYSYELCALIVPTETSNR